MASEQTNSGDIFECRQCGRCCTGFGGTYVTGEDIKRICDYTAADPDTFVEKFCDMSGSRPVLTTGNNGSCIFFDPDSQCTIHPVKPYMCKAWPFIKTLLVNPENWDIMANSCEGMKQGVPYPDIQRIAAGEKEKLDRSL